MAEMTSGKGIHYRQAAKGQKVPKAVQSLRLTNEKQPKNLWL